MLTLRDVGSLGSITNERARRRLLLNRLKKDMTTYFGFISSQELAEAFALREVLGSRQTDNPNRIAPGDPANPQSVNTARDEINLTEEEIKEKATLKDIFNQIIDTDTDAKRYLESSLSPNAPDEEKNETLKISIQNSLVGIQANDPRLIDYAKCLKLFYTKEVNHPSNPAITSGEYQLFYDNLDQALPYLQPNSETSKESRKRICALRMEHPLFAPGDSTSDLLTMFFNAMPPLEMTRATPVLNVTIHSDRPGITEYGRLSALTLQKSLEGAIPFEDPNQNPSVNALNKASVVSSSLDGQRIVTGLELFRGPQTMQNIEASKQNENHLAPIIDPMRPLASIKGFAIDMQSSYGLNGTRTGTLEIVLHDRSRLGEFANFIKPDRYGTSFVEVEYGWSHPDVNQDSSKSNPYADLLNLSRVIDQFNVTTTNFSFDEVGQVMITLNLVGRGTSETSELSITGPDSSSIQEQIKQMERLSDAVRQLSQRIPALSRNNQENTSSGTQRQEIRGIQGLSAAQDAVNNTVLTEELQQKINELRRVLSLYNNPSNTNSGVGPARGRGRRSRGAGAQQTASANSQQVAQAANELSRIITQLYGTQLRRGANAIERRASRQDTPAGRIATSINQQINQILSGINSVSPNGRWNRDNRYNDIFLQTMNRDVWTKLTRQARRNSAIDDDHRDAVKVNPDSYIDTDLGLSQGRPNPPARRRR